MIEFADMQVMMALTDAWRVTKAAGYAPFRAIFDPRLPDAVFEEVWARLELHSISFRSAWTTDVETDESIIIAVELLQEMLKEGYFTDAFFPEQIGGATAAQWAMTNEALVGIYIYGPDKDIVRVLHTWVHAALLSYKQWIIQSGLDGGFYYEGAADIGPESPLFPNGVNAYMRMQRWKFMGTEVVRRVGGPTAPTPKWITVNDRAAFVDAVRDTENRTVIPLDDNLPGGLNPVVPDPSVE